MHNGTIFFYFRTRRKEVGEEILDLLASFSDFLIFKQTILDYKAVRKTSLNVVHFKIVECCSPKHGGKAKGETCFIQTITLWLCSGVLSFLRVLLLYT